jgi:transposase InsO family protein
MNEPTAAAVPPSLSESEHVQQVRNVLNTEIKKATQPARRGFAGQQSQRKLEAHVRRRVLDFCRWTQTQGWTQRDNAERLQLCPRTLRQWREDARVATPTLRPLGRPTARSAVSQRTQVLEFLHSEGPRTGVPTLRAVFGGMARAELHDLLRRYRRVLRYRYPDTLHVLHWQVPGAVWAMDFAEAPAALDGLYPYLFAVRDLASGTQLLWQPVAALTAEVTVGALASLFALHGAPLVLKSDNGSAFLADVTKDFLAAAGVLPLFSPPGLPSYNGACEAGIGSLKGRTEGHAARHGRPAHWTWDDVAIARLEANATSRPHGPAGPTPDTLWASRRTLTAGECPNFAATLDRRRAEVCQEDGRLPFVELTDHGDRSQVDRVALQRALVEHDYLLFTRRRIPARIGV